MSWSPPAQDSLTWSPPSSDEPLGAQPPEQDVAGGSFVKGLLRQLGLTGRYAIEGALGLPDLLAEPMRMGLRAALPEEYAPKGTGGQLIADALGLPQPQGGAEMLVGDISRGVAGAGGVAGGAQALAGRVVPQAERAMAWLAANPALQAQAGTGAGIGAAVARENELGPYGSIAAQLAGGIAAPGAIRATRAFPIEPAMDIGATIGAGVFKNKRAIRRLETDALERGLGESKGAAATAMYNATEYVPGAKPTAGQAMAEFNMRQPDKVSGGWLARLEKDLTGARGVEDVLPSVAKGQESAVVKARAALNAETAPLREPVLEAINKRGGVYTKSLVKQLDDLAENSDIAGDPASLRAVQNARSYLQSLDKNGRIDARSAYAYRKSVNKTVVKAMEDTQGIGATDKKKLGVIARQIQTTIDHAIEQAAKPLGVGGRWNAYLRRFSEGSKKIDAHEERIEATAELAKKVKPIGSQVVPGEMPHAPTLLNRKMMFANWGLRLLGRDANEVVVGDLTRKLADPKAFAELLSRPNKDPLKVWALEAIKRAEQSAAMGAITNSDVITGQQ